MPRKARVRRRVHLRTGGFLYLLGTGFVGFAAVSTQINLMYAMLGLMVGVLLVAVLLQDWMLRSLRIERLRTEEVEAGEPIAFHYQLSNRSRVMPVLGLVLTELDAAAGGALRGNPQGVVYHVGPGGCVQGEAVGYTVRRGVLDLRRVRATAVFPFGLLRQSVTMDLPGSAVVYPKMERVRRERLMAVRSRESEGSRRSSTSGGSEEFFGLREYREGDPIKFVDWKHTARTGQWISREMTRPSPPKLMIVLDLRRGGGAEGETAGERTLAFGASLMCEAMADGFEVGMAVHGASFPDFAPHRGRWGRAMMLRALGELDLAVGGELRSLAPIPAGCRCVVIHAGGVDRSIGAGPATHVSHGQFEGWCVTGSESAVPVREAVA